jgi:hypothetical protein
MIWIGLTLLLVGIAPMVSAFLASWLAEAHGCILNEGTANPCMIGGADWGQALYTMFVAGWLFLLTMLLIPVGLIVFVIGFVVRARHRASAPVSDAGA